MNASANEYIHKFPPSLSVKKGLYLRLSNRAPIVEMEEKLTKIRRDHAIFKQNIRTQESKVWSDLYQLHNEIKKRSTLETYKLQDYLSKNFPHLSLCKELESGRLERDTILPPSEVYRRFVVFKALTMKDLFGDKAERRPTYSKLYNDLALKHDRNLDSYRKVIAEHSYRRQVHAGHTLIHRRKDGFYEQHKLMSPKSPTELRETQSGSNTICNSSLSNPADHYRNVTISQQLKREKALNDTNSFILPKNVTFTGLPSHYDVNH